MPELEGEFEETGADEIDALLAKVPAMEPAELKGLQERLRSIAGVFNAAAERRENATAVVADLGKGLRMIGELAKSLA